MKIVATLKIWIVIYPSITMFLYLLEKTSLVLPLYLKTLLLTITLVPWVVFVGIPLVDFLISQVRAKRQKGNPH